MDLNRIRNVREAHDVAEDMSQKWRKYASRADIEEGCIEAEQRCIRELKGWSSRVSRVAIEDVV